MSLEMKEYESLNKAFESVLKSEQEYVIIRHDLKSGDSFPRHRHFVNEWIITSGGDFRIDLARGSWMPVFHGVAVIPLPVGTSHGIKINGGMMSYFVLREKWSWRPSVIAHRIVDFIIKAVDDSES